MDEASFTALKINMHMHQETISFDRVFDIVRGGRGSDREPSTLFSFDSGDKRQYGVAVPGEPEISDRMTVTAILGEAENWQTLIGWVNHRTGEVTCKTPPACNMVMALPFSVASAFVLKEKSLLGAAMLTLSIGLFMKSAWDTYRLMAIQRKLKGLAERFTGTRSEKENALG